MQEETTNAKKNEQNKEGSSGNEKNEGAGSHTSVKMHQPPGGKSSGNCELLRSFDCFFML